MKLNGKTLGPFVVLGALGSLVGGLAWELLERVLAGSGIHLDFSVGPVGFDLHVVALHFLVNPGTFLGLIGGLILFRFL
jgi:hypothetical protein